MRLDPNETELPIVGQPGRPAGASPGDAGDADAMTAELAALEAELAAFEAAERERLGLRAARRQWADDMLTPTVKRRERETITILVAGLTPRRTSWSRARCAGWVTTSAASACRIPSACRSARSTAIAASATRRTS
jgi:hypothetical protein